MQMSGRKRPHLHMSLLSPSPQCFELAPLVRWIITARRWVFNFVPRVVLGFTEFDTWCWWRLWQRIGIRFGAGRRLKNEGRKRRRQRWLERPANRTPATSAPQQNMQINAQNRYETNQPTAVVKSTTVHRLKPSKSQSNHVEYSAKLGNPW